jgi:hypothetical protein
MALRNILRSRIYGRCRTQSGISVDGSHDSVAFAIRQLRFLLKNVIAERVAGLALGRD